jgi:hypothetical protein
MTLGFTGTQDGMTIKQGESVLHLLKSLKPEMVIHGDCIGSDKQFHDIVRGWNSACIIKVYPSTISKKRAGCDADIIMPIKAPLERNVLIVADCQRLIVCPKETTPVIRSGTWSTWRKARNTGKVIYLVVPNGEVR